MDNGNPALSSSTRVVVSVDDVNDNAPEFLERFYKVQIPGTLVAEPNSAVLQVLSVCVCAVRTGVSVHPGVMLAREPRKFFTTLDAREPACYINRRITGLKRDRWRSEEADCV